MKRIANNNNTVSDMIEACASVVDRDTAKSGIRALCRHFGGQIIYIPAARSEGKTAEELRGVLADATSDTSAEKMLERIMRIYGHLQVYIPLERTGFKHEIALEIFARYNADDKKIGDLCREYNVSFTQIYNLWHEGQKIHILEKSPALDFGE
jgi:Mor family transcriptional regulator